MKPLGFWGMVQRIRCAPAPKQCLQSSRGNAAEPLPQSRLELVLERRGQDEVADPPGGVRDLIVRRRSGPSGRDMPNRIAMVSATGSRSISVIAPVSRASGRSIDERNVTAGNPRIVDSPAIVPESDSTQAA